MKVLLHTCCGPCASAYVPELKELGHVAAMYFANDNIDTREEFDRRLAAARIVAEAEGVELTAADYNPADWRARAAAGFEAAPERGARCARCFAYNLARTAAAARARGFDAFTTSLTVSPHKPTSLVFAAGRAVAEQTGVPFLEIDFKKKDGFKKSLARSRELGLYRQSYCGCAFAKAAQEACGA